MTGSYSRYLTPKEVAEMLRLGEGMVRELLDDGRIPAYRWGSTWSIPLEPLERFLEEELNRQMAQRGGKTSGARWEESLKTARPGLPDSSLRATSTPRRTQEIEFMLRGKSFRVPNAIGLLETVLKELASSDESFLYRLSGLRGRKRRYVSRDPALLYDGRPDLAERYVRPLGDGWWMGTNYSRTIIDKVLREACTLAGLKFGRDLVVKSGTRPNRLRALEIIGLATDSRSDVAGRHAEYYAHAVESSLRSE